MNLSYATRLLFFCNSQGPDHERHRALRNARQSNAPGEPITGVLTERLALRPHLSCRTNLVRMRSATAAPSSRMRRRRGVAIRKSAWIGGRGDRELAQAQAAVIGGYPAMSVNPEVVFSEPRSKLAC